MCKDEVVKSIDFTGSKQSFLGSFGIVDINKAIKTIQNRAGVKTVNIEKVNDNAKNGLLYATREGIPLQGVDKDTESKAKYLIVPIGYRDKYTGYDLCASFLKGSFAWEGVYISTIGNLLERAIRNFNKRMESEDNSNNKLIGIFNKIKNANGFGIEEILKNNYENIVAKRVDFNLDKETTEDTDNNKNKDFESLKDIISKVVSMEKSDVGEIIKNKVLYDEIYDRLLIKENWRASSKNRLEIYLKSLVEIIAREQRSNDSTVGCGYVLTEDKEKCVFNTGLIDEYNNDIYLLDLTNKQSTFLKKDILIVTSKAVLIMQGFNKEDIKEMPGTVKLYKDKSDLIFNGTLDDFDLVDNNRLYHIVEERRSRFPIEYKNTPPDVLSDKVKNAIRNAIRISERDYRYIIPMYNLKYDSIQYLIPFYLNKSIDESPDLVIVVGRNNGFYCVCTILTTDIAYDNARLLCRLDGSWLKVGNNTKHTSMDTDVDTN